MKSKENKTIVLTQNQVATVEGVSVGCANFADTDYTKASGESEFGRTAALSIFGEGDSSEDIRVGAGSNVEIGGRSWQVKAVNQRELELVPTE